MQAEGRLGAAGLEGVGGEEGAPAALHRTARAVPGVSGAEQSPAELRLSYKPCSSEAPKCSAD